MKSQIKTWILENLKPQKSIRKKVGTYWLKHVIEDEIGDYVAEEEVIEALRALDFEEHRGHFNIVLTSPLKNADEQRRKTAEQALGYRP